VGTYEEHGGESSPLWRVAVAQAGSKEGLLFLKKKKQKDFYSFGAFGWHRRAKNNE
jgi:hypothetical protein